MPIKKLVPKVPDPYIGKNELNQFWPARFGHLDYLVDEINNGGAIPEGFAQMYTELITIPGTVFGAGPGPLFIDFPADGLSQQLISQGKYVIPIGFTVATLETTAPSLLPITATGLSFSIWNNTFTYGTAITNEFVFNGGGGPYPQAGVTYIPAISESGGSILQAQVFIDPLGTKFRLQRTAGGGIYNGTSDNCVKIAFSFQAIDLNWFFKLTN